MSRRTTKQRRAARRRKLSVERVAWLHTLDWMSKYLLDTAHVLIGWYKVPIK